MKKLHLMPCLDLELPHMRTHLHQSPHRTRRQQKRKGLVVDMHHGSARDIHTCLLDRNILWLNSQRALWSTQTAMGNSPSQRAQRLSNHDA